MRNIFGIILFAGLVFFFGLCGGCNVVGYMASPTNSEKEVPAEYRVKDVEKGGVLVLVDQARGSGAGFDVSSELGQAIKLMLVKNARLNGKNVYVYDKLSLLQESEGIDADASVSEIAGDYGAETVVYVLIDDYSLYLQDSRGYYGGSMTAGAMVLEGGSESKVWPVGEEVRMARAKVEFETGGAAETQGRLVRVVSHIITRSLYDCKKDRYKIADEVHYYDQQMKDLRDL